MATFGLQKTKKGPGYGIYGIERTIHPTSWEVTTQSPRQKWQRYQAFIKALERPDTTTKLVRLTKNALNRSAESNRVLVTWVPGHLEYRGNGG